MNTQPLPVALADVLARGDVWRGDTLATLPESAIPSGHAELDAELPGGGWPRGNLTEILVDRSSVGEMSLLLPALARLSADGVVSCATCHDPKRAFADAHRLSPGVFQRTGTRHTPALIARSSSGLPRPGILRPSV